MKLEFGITIFNAMNVRLAANHPLNNFTNCMLEQVLVISKLCEIAPMGMPEDLIDDKS